MGHTPTDRDFVLGTRPGLDGLRGLAVVLVIAMHYGLAVPALAPYVGGGFIGVEVFFVLSGFLITSIVLEELDRSSEVDLASFYRRRAYRLLPALYVLVIGCISLDAFTPIRDFGTTREQVVVGVAALTYVFNLLTPWAFSHTPIWAAPLWSLCVEIHFYALWPSFLRYAAKRRDVLIARGAIALIVFSVVFRIVIFETKGTPYQSFLTPSRLDGLALGALAAFAIHRGYALPRRLRGIGVAGLVVLAGMTYAASLSSRWTVYLGYSLVSLATALVLVDALDGESVTYRILHVRPLRELGALSYALYLWHLPMYFIVDRWLPETAWLPLVAVFASITVAAASTRLVEMPLRHIGQNRRAQRVATVGGTAGSAAS